MWGHRMLRRMVRKSHQRHVATGLWSSGNSFYEVTNHAFLMGEFGGCQENITCLTPLYFPTVETLGDYVHFG